MPEIVDRSPDNAEFPRVVEIARLRGSSGFDFDLSPTPQEAKALARLMGAQEVRKLRFAGRLASSEGGAWRLHATLGATVVQTCVVSLDPVTTRVDAPVTRIFSPHAGAAGVDVAPPDGPDDEDEVEPLGSSIDLGLVAIEALALALPAYPRKEGVELGVIQSAPPGAEPLAGGEVKPFAALAALRAKWDEES